MEYDSSLLQINRSIYGDDLPYALGIPMDGPSNHYTSDYTIQEEQLSETVLRYFTNFAKSGYIQFTPIHII